MTSERTIGVSQAESWALDDLIRHTWTEEGRQVGKGLLLKVFTVIKEFEARRNDPHPPDTLPIALTEDECWVIDFHVRRGYVDPEGYRIGRPLLLKIFGLLLEMRNQEDVRLMRLAEANSESDNASERARRFEEWRDMLNRDKAGGEGDAPDST